MSSYSEFWDAPHRDASDLAVIVSGDMCEKKIDVRDYLAYQDNLDTLTVVRYCLLLGEDIENLQGMTPRQIQEHSEALLHKVFKFYDGSEHRRNYFLQLIQYPFARWGPECLWIDHCSVDLKGMTDIKEMSIKLSKALDFEYFSNSYDLVMPVFTIQQP